MRGRLWRRRRLIAAGDKRKDDEALTKVDKKDGVSAAPATVDDVPTGHAGDEADAQAAVETEAIAAFSTDVSELRSKSRDRLLEILKAEAVTASPRCFVVAEAVELAMSTLFPEVDTDAKHKRDYAAKLRQLVFNLKKNHSLRDRLLVGDVSAASLCAMSVDELATTHVREQREQARNFLHDARSLDWSKRNRDKINKSIGINDATGMFQCNRCKSK